MSDRDIIEGTVQRMGWRTMDTSPRWSTYQRDEVTITVAWSIAEQNREGQSIAARTDGSTTGYAKALGQVYAWLCRPPAAAPSAYVGYDETPVRLMSASGVVRFEPASDEKPEVEFGAAPQFKVASPAPPIARSVARFRELEF